VNMVGVVVAVDGVLGDQRLREIQGLDGQIEQAPSIVAADRGGQRRLTRGEAEDRLSAAPARGSVTDDARLEQGDLKPALRQVQRCGAAGDTAPEDHHVGPNGAAQCFAMGRRAFIGELRRGCGGSSVIGVGGWVEEAQASSLLWVVFKILWLLTGLGACEPTGLFDHGAMFPRCTNRR
jgi:hypothetical protein